MVRRTEFVALGTAALAASAAGCDRSTVESGSPPPLPPAPSFAEASEGIRTIIGRDVADESLERVAMPRLYVHDGPVDNAVLLFHGFTNCPQQFDELARLFYGRGCNVYVPRIPLHGRADRLTRALSSLNVPMLQASAEEAYGFVRGLGRRVTALGLSLGGSMAMWLAQTRPLDLAVSISPFLMPLQFSRPVGNLLMRTLDILPDMYWWWDPRIKENIRPIYAYPGYPTHALAQCVFLGDAIFAQLRNEPLGRRCTLVTNANEPAVNNNVARELTSHWRQSGMPCDEFVFHDLGKPRHDIIDPTTFPAARTLVYPKLESIVLNDRATQSAG